MSCANSTAASLSRKQSFPVLMLRTELLKRPLTLRSRPEVHWPSDFHRRAFFVCGAQLRTCSRPLLHNDYLFLRKTGFNSFILSTAECCFHGSLLTPKAA
jgi:hypothetical protein